MLPRNVWTSNVHGFMYYYILCLVYIYRLKYIYININYIRPIEETMMEKTGPAGEKTPNPNNNINAHYRRPWLRRCSARLNALKIEITRHACVCVCLHRRYIIMLYTPICRLYMFIYVCRCSDVRIYRKLVIREHKKSRCEYLESIIRNML